MKLINWIKNCKYSILIFGIIAWVLTYVLYCQIINTSGLVNEIVKWITTFLFTAGLILVSLGTYIIITKYKE